MQKNKLPQCGNSMCVYLYRIKNGADTVKRHMEWILFWEKARVDCFPFETLELSCGFITSPSPSSSTSSNSNRHFSLHKFTHTHTNPLPPYSVFPLQQISPHTAAAAHFTPAPTDSRNFHHVRVASCSIASRLYPTRTSKLSHSIN